MTEQHTIESSEQLREALLALRHEHDALLESSSQGQHLLDALDSLLDPDVADDPFVRVFAALRKLFSFAQAMMLAEREGLAAGDKHPLERIVAEPDNLIGPTWPTGPLFRKIMPGRVLATLSNAGVAEWSYLSIDSLTVNQSVLYVPVGVRGRRGKLLLANDAVSSIYDRPAGELIGTEPFALDSDDAEVVVTRRHLYQNQLHSGEQRSREKTVNVAGCEHTLLVTDKPVRIHTELLLLTASLDITDRRHFEEELSHRAFHDQLTGLPNRALRQQLVDAALRTHERSGQFALAFIDLDNFKQVNDYYSHAIGDALLKAMAERVNQSIRSGDTLARISGDEFLLPIDPLERSATLPVVINRVLGALKEPFCNQGHEVMTSASVGASIFPVHGNSYESLRRCADNGMYRAKSSRKGSVT